MNQFDKKILKFKAEVARKIIDDCRDDMLETGAKIEIEVLKKERKKAKVIFDETLGEDSEQFIDFRIRKRSELEKKLLLMQFGFPIFIGFCLLTAIGSIFGWWGAHIETFFSYVINAIAFVLGLYVLRISFKTKIRSQFLIAIFVMLFNGMLLVYHLGELF